MNQQIKKSIYEALIVIFILVIGLIFFSFVIPTRTYERILQVLSDILYWIV